MPISLMRYGRLKTPVPMALASNVNMDPLMDPGCRGPKALSIKVLSSVFEAADDSSSVRMVITRSAEVSERTGYEF
mgnify:CR=1 FL=1|jgi:hypothetical protein